MSFGNQATASPTLTSPRASYVDVLFQQAQILQRDGQLAAAQAVYKKVLKRRANHFGAWHLLGVCGLLSHDYEAAARSLKRAVLLDTQSVAARSDLGVVLKALQRNDEALACFDRVIELNPDFTNGHYNRGSLLMGMRRFDEALKSLDDAIAIDPHYANALINRASVLIDLQRNDEALACFDRVIELKPDFTNGHYSRGSLLKGMGRFHEALKSLDDAIAIDPHHANALIYRASVLLNLGKFADAIASCERAIELNLEGCDAIVKRGLTLLHPNRAKEAIGDFDLTLAWSYRGEALRCLGRPNEALANSDRALAINSEFAEVWHSRGFILLELEKIAEAELAFQRALTLQPDNPEVITGLGTCLGRKGESDAALACFDRALAIQPDFEMALTSRIFTLDFSADCDFAAHQSARTEWWRRIGESIYAKRPQRHKTDCDSTRRIVLGYVSADFRDHSAAFSFRPVLEKHDKTRFEVICYSAHPTEDAVTASFRNVADQWRDTSHWPDNQLGDCIRADKVDILIDLSGHSSYNRLRVFAGKPAPIQVTAWGHATGTGQPSIDYLFSDPVMVPAEVRHLFAEQIYDLPCATIIEPPPAEFRSSEAPVTANGYLTYGVFNRISKISDAAIAVWARILRSDVTARLIIKHIAIDDASTRSMLQDKFASHGIAQDRLQLIGKTSREDHLAAYRHVDICLDPFPQGGGASTWEALHMGVPVVTKLGNAIPKRLGGAILSSIGMADWVGTDDDQYVDIALRWTPDQLRTLRRELPGLINARCGPTAYTRAVEEGYRTMWEKYCEAIHGEADESTPTLRNTHGSALSI